MSNSLEELRQMLREELERSSVVPGASPALPDCRTCQRFDAMLFRCSLVNDICVDGADLLPMETVRLYQREGE